MDGHSKEMMVGRQRQGGHDGQIHNKKVAKSVTPLSITPKI